MRCPTCGSDVVAEDLISVEKRIAWAERFEWWWQRYPRRVKPAKGACLELWMKMVPNEDVEERYAWMADKLRRYTELEWKDPRYIPHPKTFLNVLRKDLKWIVKMRKDLKLGVK